MRKKLIKKFEEDRTIFRCWYHKRDFEPWPPITNFGCKINSKYSQHAIFNMFTWLLCK